MFAPIRILLFGYADEEEIPPVLSNGFPLGRAAKQIDIGVWPLNLHEALSLIKIERSIAILLHERLKILQRFDCWLDGVLETRYFSSFFSLELIVPIRFEAELWHIPVSSKEVNSKHPFTEQKQTVISHQYGVKSTQRICV